MRFLGALKKDDLVYLPRLARRCVIKKLDRVREVATLDAGSMRLEVPFDELSWIVPLDAGA